jgi:ABC-type phosphate transport system substrate-binding protein
MEVKTMRKRNCLVAGVVFALALVAVDWSPASPARASAADRLLINGAGATFPNPIYAKWFDEYQRAIQTSKSTTNPLDRAGASASS